MVLFSHCKKNGLAAWCMLLAIIPVAAQNLSFTKPAIFLPEAVTDRAVDITNFNGVYFVTWKEAGDAGYVHYSCLGKQYDTETISTASVIAGQQTAAAPVLRVFNQRIYLFWISPDGALKYIINNSATSFNTTAVYEVHFTRPVKLSKGITATPVNGKIMVASHGAGKDDMVCSLLLPGTDGVFTEAEAMPVSNEKSTDYPFVVTLGNKDVRFSWRGKDQLVYYTDYNTNSKVWSKSISLGSAKTSTSPAIYQVWNADRLFYFWSGGRNANSVYYASATDEETPLGGQALPDVFATRYPVSVCKVDDNNFLLAYPGADRHLYLSSFSNYNAASWMEQVLAPLTSTKTLQDIVIPGAHDAGMSVLNGVGGQQSGTINPCNTLTQKLNIEQQLNAGIRMFDLRAGTYQNQLHAKHCASDCMADAIGGGYGEKINKIASGIRRFLQTNRQEIILISFSHFCEKETPIAALKDSLVRSIGKEFIYSATGAGIGHVLLKDLAGKVVITFETNDSSDKLFPSCSIADRSAAFVNFRRMYAATNDIKKLLEKEKLFFSAIDNEVQKNELIRLDWQLTQTSDEAPMICNDFEDEKLSPVVNGVMLLANVIRKHKSIIDHSLDGNKYLPATLDNWIQDGTINKKNKPHILYVDVAGAWITDYCIDLNKTALYR